MVPLKRWDRWHSPSPNWQEQYHLYTTYNPPIGSINHLYTTYSPCRIWGGEKCYRIPPFRGTISTTLGDQWTFGPSKFPPEVLVFLLGFFGTILQGPSLRSGAHLVVSILTLPYPRSSKWLKLDRISKRTDWHRHLTVSTCSNPLQNLPLFRAFLVICSRQIVVLLCVSTAWRIKTNWRWDAGWVKNVSLLFVNSPNKIDLK